MSNYAEYKLGNSNHTSLVGRPQKSFRRPTSPVSFETWFLMGIRRMEWYGAEFTLYTGFVRIQWPGKTAILRTVQDFEREYQEEYLSKFY
jgi:hypothetical protein